MQNFDRFTEYFDTLQKLSDGFKDYRYRQIAEKTGLKYELVKNLGDKSGAETLILEQIVTIIVEENPELIYEPNT